MQKVNGVYLPDDEREMSQFLMAQTVDGYGAYQIEKLRAALKYVKQFRAAVDVGAHCGLWAMRLESLFDFVYAFEPIEEHRQCLRLNAPKAHIFACALGEAPGTVKMTPGKKSTGDTHIDPEGEIEVHLQKLDVLKLPNIDFMKLDCEGYELFALRGAEETLLKWKPVICVEQKPGKGEFFGLGDTDAVKYLESLGWTLREAIVGDYILSYGRG